MKTTLKFLLPLLVVLASCSLNQSPEKDGEKAALQYCETMDAYIADVVQKYNNFLREFHNKGYDSRLEAREDLARQLTDARLEYDSKVSLCEDSYNALLDKYMDNQEKLLALTNSYHSTISAYSVDSTMFAPLLAQSNAKILSIIPPQPNEEKIKEDLIGRAIHALPGGYFNDSWRWNIEKGEIKSLIVNEIDDIDSNNKEITFNMTLQASGAAYKIKAKAFYKLGDGDDWEIDMLEPADIEIVKTGRYDNSIVSGISSTFWGHKYLTIRNNSDKALLVGFQTLIDYGGWEKSSMQIPGGETKNYQRIGPMIDYKIDFVELP